MIPNAPDSESALTLSLNRHSRSHLPAAPGSLTEFVPINAPYGGRDTLFQESVVSRQFRRIISSGEALIFVRGGMNTDEGASRAASVSFRSFLPFPSRTRPTRRLRLRFRSRPRAEFTS